MGFQVVPSPLDIIQSEYLFLFGGSQVSRLPLKHIEMVQWLSIPTQWGQPAHRSPIRIHFNFQPWKLPWIIYVTIYSYTPYIENNNNGVIPRERERRESEFGIDQIDSLPFGLLRTAHLHHIPSQYFPPCHLGLKPFVHIRGTPYSVLCVTDDCQSPTFKEYTQLCYVGPQVQHN